MTMGGFGLSEFVNMTSSPRMVAVIQAFVVGALLHVVTHTSTHQFGHHHDGHECDTKQSHPHAHGPVHSACNHHHTNEFHRDGMPTSAEHDEHSHPPVDDLEFHSQCEHGHPFTTIRLQIPRQHRPRHPIQAVRYSMCSTTIRNHSPGDYRISWSRRWHFDDVRPTPERPHCGACSRICGCWTNLHGSCTRECTRAPTRICNRWVR